MRGIKCLPWACLAALILLIGPAVDVSVAAGKPFVAPVSAEVTRGFEPPSHRFASGHRGIDYGVPIGTVVRASGAGTVSFAGPVADGLYVTIQHLNDIATTYSYLSRVEVQRGDQIAQGQIIGLSGNGHDSGPAGLHFGAKQKEEYIDPEILLQNFDDITDLISLAQLPNGAIGGHAAFINPQDSGLMQTGGSNRGHSGRAPVEQAVSPGSANSLPPKTDDAVTVSEPLPAGPKVVKPDGLPDSEIATAPSADRFDVPTDAKWWRSIPEEFKQELLQQDPNFLKNFSGVSARERDDLNRELLNWKIEKLKRQRAMQGPIATVRHNMGIVAKGMFLSPLSVLSKYDRESAIDRKIRSAEALRDQLTAVTNDSRKRLGMSDVYLLDFDIDFANGDGKAVVALGDPGTAEHIGVMVPGINNAVGSIGGPLRDAAFLRSEVHRTVEKDLDRRTSTIVWMGYDNPNGLQDAVNRGEAEEAAPWLKTFVNDLRTRHVESPEAPHITVFGHSYGSTVTGIAALDGMKANDVVFLGSPGVGRFFVDAGDFPQRMWAARPWTDVITVVSGALGVDPTSESFNAFKVPLGPEQRGHSDYYALGTKGLQNLARILVGKVEDVQ